MRCELERSLGGQLCQEYSYKKLLKSDNPLQVTILNVGDLFLRHGVFSWFSYIPDCLQVISYALLYQ